MNTSPGAISINRHQSTLHYHLLNWQQLPPTPFTRKMSSITNQSTKKLGQGTNAALPNAESRSVVLESGSQPNEVWGKPLPCKSS